MCMTWEFSSDRPIYAQLVEELKLRIVSGWYPLGARLPSVRELASEAAVNPNTMQRALSELEESGLIYTQRTNGKFVTEDERRITYIKDSLATDQSEEYIKRMGHLGFSPEDAVAFLEGRIASILNPAVQQPTGGMV